MRAFPLLMLEALVAPPAFAGTIGLAAVCHRFSSDRLERRYRDEIDRKATAKRRRYAALVQYADYRAHDFATDTNKLWLSLEWSRS